MAIGQQCKHGERPSPFVMSSPNDEGPAIVVAGGGTGGARRSAFLGSPETVLGGCERFLLSHGLVEGGDGAGGGNRRA
ncbi:hypothetical protein EVAR_12868_1 [Eumeta japonica]|uniref:Uncharacterized protein n=1 Tax=Eumeta variegata TaxID=151549 RepID=A0A4C1TVR5_EUMVA|nr:hypothetical protein EVAR_12868_1 [Eumeta japonica]